MWSVQAGHFEPPSDDPRSISLDSLRLGVEHRFRDSFALLGELDLASFDGAPEVDGGVSDAAGFGLDGLLRWYAIDGEAWGAFVDFGLGLLATDEAFPSGGTRLNGTRHIGVGAAFDIPGPLALTFSVRQQHVSNGRGLVDDNPSWEGLGAMIGLQMDAGRAERMESPRRDLPPIVAWPWSLRVEGRAGEIGGTAASGALLAADARVAGPLHVQLRAGLDDLAGESLREMGGALYARRYRGLFGVGYDRQELDVFSDDETTIFGEWYANDLMTVAGSLGYEARKLQEDRVALSLLFKAYPLDWLSVGSGIVGRETREDFGQESFGVPLSIELALPTPAGVSVSVFAEDGLDDDSSLVGLRLVLGGSGRGAACLRDRDRAMGPLRLRP
ncbi:MAG: acyloxyacyl hydrolase [Planctomycetes bacterium]|nr:acyloxyacyl hydrolase [Planctomycetota bacterium]